MQSRPTLKENGATHPNFSKLNCYVDRLKALNKLDESFPKFDASKDDPINCTSYVGRLEKAFYDDVDTYLKNKPKFVEFKDCILKKYKSHHIAVESLKSSVNRASELSSTEKHHKQNVIKANVLKMTFDAYNSCGVYKKQFGSEFDSFQNIYKEELLEDYCVRKHVVESNIIDTVNYKIIPNLHDIDVTDVSCKEIVQTSAEKFYVAEIQKLKAQGLFKDDDEAECKLKKFREADYASRVMSILILSELQMTGEQKEAERKSYINFRTKMEQTKC